MVEVRLKSSWVHLLKEGSFVTSSMMADDADCAYPPKVGRLTQASETKMSRASLRICTTYPPERYLMIVVTERLKKQFDSDDACVHKTT